MRLDAAKPGETAARAAPIVVVMGVSGCGKSSVARALAATYSFAFIEADDHHPEANRRHMAAGRALTDAMREPFVASLCAAIGVEPGPCVVAFSALRRVHRERVRALGRPTLFLHLAAAADQVAARLQARRGHFMPADLLASQFAALEPAQHESDLQTLAAQADLVEVCECASRCVRDFLHGLDRTAGSGLPHANTPRSL